MKRRVVLCALVAASACPAAALAQWSDNFDSYATGSINGQGGWKGWDGAPSAAGSVSTEFSLTLPNSQQIGGAADSVHEYTGVTSGKWTYTAQQYIPSSFTSGSTYFILMNKYTDGGPHTGPDNWSVELQFLGDTGLIVDDFRPGGPIPFVRDQWAEIRIELDLTLNTISQFYNGALISAGTWTNGPTSAMSLAAVDLFANGTTNVYYDNMSLIPAPATAALPALAGLFAARRRRA